MIRHKNGDKYEHPVEGFVKKHIEKNPEEYNDEEHSHLFSDEEKTNLSMSMR